jgi:hypothetical protein
MLNHIQPNLNLFPSAMLPTRWAHLLRGLRASRGSARRTTDVPACTRPDVTPAQAARTAAPLRRPAAPATVRQGRSLLRVVRILDPGQASASAGRILMSGRMADVCAELDRMVEREAALQARA